MVVVRPVVPADVPALEALAAAATLGVHTLPKSRERFEQIVERSQAAFSAQVDFAGDESYIFVLESLTDGGIVGTAAISATAGANGTFFAFRNDVIHQVSRDLNIAHSVHALTLCSDLTGYTQLSSFFIRGGYESRGEAALLSRARILFAACSPQRFADRFFASLAGVTDGEGHSPFWEALGRKFFKMDFLQAERMVEGSRNRSLIVELMPHYPVYVPILPESAQAAMGQVHPEGELPLRILSEEGFETDEFIDIFDGGPILQAHRQALRSFSGAVRRQVAGVLASDAESRVAPCMVANPRQSGFRAMSLDLPRLELSESVLLPAYAMDALGVVPGDEVMCVRM